MFGLILKGLFGAILAYMVTLRVQSIKENLNYIGLPQTEVTTGGNLLDINGQLVETGWSKKALKTFNSEAIPSHLKLIRLKKWDFYSVFHEGFFFGLALADIGFAQNVQITFFEVENQTFIHKDQILVPLLHQRLDLKDNLYLNESPQQILLEAGGFVLNYTGVKSSLTKEERYIKLTLEHQGHNLDVDIRIDSNTEEERIVLYQQINSKGSQFFYNTKSYNWLPKGTVKFDNQTFEVLQSLSNAGMDWGRGIWNHHTFWLWASGMGFDSKGQRFAINLGGGFQDQKAKATEETIFINKKLIKLRDLVYQYDLQNLDVPFVVRSHDVRRDNFDLKFSWEDEKVEQNPKFDYRPGQFYCEFLPVHRNTKNTDLLLLHMNFEQYMGIFSGVYVNDKGELDQFNDIMGLIEFNKAKW